MAAAGCLRGRSLPELREMLRRQERLLADRKFIDKLPDKGKKISDFAEKLTRAISEEEELTRTAQLLSAIRLELQAERGRAHPDGQHHTGPSALSDSSHAEVPQISSQRQEAQRLGQDPTGTALENERTRGQNDGIKTVTKDENLCCEAPVSHRSSEQQTSRSDAERGAGCASDSCKDTLVEAFQKVTIGDGENSEKGLEKEQSASKHKGNIFGSLHPKTPHYIEVLESRAKNPVIKKSKFRTNALPGEQCGSSHGSSPSQSPGGSGSLITAEERRLRDKKHLNDITAARLPPLHHAPAKLLSLEESIAIQIQQKEAYEEMQAKVAAQKLGERSNIKMTSFEPEGEAAMQYREVRDEDYFSAED
ncbi:UNVERIFIED_CONTAM: hypothetical protein H355_009804 [Colinus virginianus]|nr:hypothetical protein H355_009804 [Colinus virginianus]